MAHSPAIAHDIPRPNLRMDASPRQLLQLRKRPIDDLEPRDEIIQTADICHKRSRIEHWTKCMTWPDHIEPHTMATPALARRKSTTSLRRQRSSQTLDNPSSSILEEKSAPYKHARYEDALQNYGVYMDKDRLGPTPASVKSVERLLALTREVPANTLFDMLAFDPLCDRLRTRNESRLVRDLTPLIAPSPEALAFHGQSDFLVLRESVNEPWTSCIPLTKPRPQPDQATGFDRTAFSSEQLRRLSPFLGSSGDVSFYLSTYYMLFSFLTVEVKSGAAALDVADRQNAHSAAVNVRAIVMLYQSVGREKELDRVILAFSISHDHESVRIFGHYAIIGAERHTYHRHSFRKFDFTERDGYERWTSYKFVRNLYDAWVPAHLQKLRDIVDLLPLPSEVVSHSQSTDSAPFMEFEDDGSQTPHLPASSSTPATSFTQQVDEERTPKARRRREKSLR